MACPTVSDTGEKGEGSALEVQNICAGGHLLSSGLESSGRCWEWHTERGGEDGGGTLEWAPVSGKGAQMAAEAPEPQLP